MHIAARLYLLWISLRARWRSYVWVTLGMALGMFALGLSMVTGLGFGRSLEQYLSSIFPENRILLRPKVVNMIWLQVETAKIGPDTVEKVAALPGVKRLSPEATLQFPVSAEATLVGVTYRTDISVTGVHGWLLGDDEPANFTYDFSKGGQVPCVVAQYFLELYNMTLAESNNLPKLSEAAAVGRQFRLFLGESSLRPGKRYNADAKVRELECRVAGLSRNPNLLGLVVPLEAVEAMNAWYGITKKEYRSLHVELETAEAIDNIREKLPELGLELVDSTATWRRALAFIQLVGWGFVGFGALVFALSLGYLASSVEWMLAKRKREQGLFHALGAGTGRVVSLIGMEIGLISGLGIGLGIGLCAVAFYASNRWYLDWRQGREFLPEQLFAFPLSWLLLLALAGWLVACAMALHRIWREARKPVIDILSHSE
ncbi:MAG: FtsX-like permease family protein [Candidatus Sumerlaeia bacterium]